MNGSLAVVAKLGHLTGDATASLGAVVLMLVVIAYWILKT